MTLRERLHRIIEPLPPGAPVVLPRECIEEWLASDDAPLAPTSERVLIDLTIKEVASLMGKKESTVRGWLQAGEIEGAYKLHGREWRIPHDALRKFQERQRTRSLPKPTMRRGATPDWWAWRDERKGRVA